MRIFSLRIATRVFVKPHFENPRLPSTCLRSVPIIQNFACIIHRIHKWRTHGKKLVPNHENEALEDKKHKFLTDSTVLVNLQSGDFFFLQRFGGLFFTVTGFLGCHQAVKFTVVFPFATKQAA